MAQAHPGNTVKVHYTGRLDDGTVFDSSQDRDPLEFTLGANQVISGFEAAIDGMSPGDEKTVTIPSAQAYGPERPDLIADVERERFPEGFTPEVGQRLQMLLPDGRPIQVTVLEVRDGKVTLDANHPLAGKDLTFDLRLVEIN